jgi:hypothetical protein
MYPFSSAEVQNVELPSAAESRARRVPRVIALGVGAGIARRLLRLHVHRVVLRAVDRRPATLPLKFLEELLGLRVLAGVARFAENGRLVTVVGSGGALRARVTERGAHWRIETHSETPLNGKDIVTLEVGCVYGTTDPRVILVLGVVHDSRLFVISLMAE